MKLTLRLTSMIVPSDTVSDRDVRARWANRLCSGEKTEREREREREREIERRKGR